MVGSLLSYFLNRRGHEIDTDIRTGKELVRLTTIIESIGPRIDRMEEKVDDMADKVAGIKSVLTPKMTKLLEDV